MYVRREEGLFRILSMSFEIAMVSSKKKKSRFVLGSVENDNFSLTRPKILMVWI